jgi:hypothetical protein
MDDHKLTVEEYAIRDILHSQSALFKLFNHSGGRQFGNGYGLWSDGGYFASSSA